jgi:hypothetical protein
MTNKDSLVYRSGDAFLPHNIRGFLQTYLIGGPTSSFYITYWSIVHLLSGIAFALLFLWVRPATSTEVYVYGLGVHTAWELWQIGIGMSRPFALSGPGSLVDIAVDTLLFMAGIWLALFLQNRLQPLFKAPAKQPFSFFRA